MLCSAVAPRPAPITRENPNSLPVIFDRASALGNPTAPATLGAITALDQIIRELAEHGALEVRR